MTTVIQHHLDPVTDSSSLLLTPQVLEKLEIIQKQQPKKPILPTPSKSAEANHLSVNIQPEKSVSLTLAERRKNLNPTSLDLSFTDQHEYQITDQLIKKVLKNQNVKDQQEELDNRQKLLSTLNFNRHLIWNKLCQTTATSEQVAYFDEQLAAGIPQLIQIEHLDEPILRILNVYSIKNTYYPGMANLISPLLLIMPENEAYAVFVRMLELYDIHTCYQHMEDRLHEFQNYFKRNCPELSQHFENQGVQPEMYATDWFLFRLPTQYQAELIDLVMLEGYVDTILRFTLSCLQRHQTAISNMNQEEILEFISSSNFFDLEDRHIWIQSIFDLSPIVLEPVQKRSSRILTSKTKKKPAPQQTVPVLQQQIEDLILAMSRLEKEHAALSQQNLELKMKEVNDEQTQSKLIKRNAVLEKRLKKYKTKLANTAVTNTVTTQTEEPKEDESKKQEKYNNFVESLRETGEFGALIATALAPTTPSQPEQKQQQQQLDAALQNVTSELVAVKLDNFETQQKYERLLGYCQELEQKLQMAQSEQDQACQRIAMLENELDDVQMERDSLIKDQEEVIEMAMVAKKTSTELQLEKLNLSKQVEKLEQTIQVLEEEKKNYFMPRSTFTEEVFAAHSILFGQQKKKKEVNRRHTLQLSPKQDIEPDEYKSKYVESELRCRELEKYLAETKVKLAEFEASTMPSRRASTSVQYKRSSTASLSMLANRVSTPTSPRRESTESFASSTTSMTSINSSKRSSGLYSKIWGAFGTQPQMVNMKNNVLCDEPQIVQQP